MSAVPAKSNVPPKKSFAQVLAQANAFNVRTEKQSSQSTSVNNTQPSIGKLLDNMNGFQTTETPSINVSSPSVSERTTHNRDNHVGSLSSVLEATNLGEASNSFVSSHLDTSTKESPDQKSCTSRVTLTLDEKESLRPDDSASMQAAAEEDTFSPIACAPTGLRRDSNDEARAFREQLEEIEMNGAGHRIIPPPIIPALPLLSRARNGVATYPAPPIAEQVNVAAPAVADSTLVAPHTIFQPPDEKLIEALASPKDRLFVLKIEQDIIDFIKDSKYEREDFLQLPQTNSFYRMLSHKLADYYFLGHAVDDSMLSVRIFKIPASRLPPPLLGSEFIVEGATPPPTAPARKIMRRTIAANRAGFSTPPALSDEKGGTASANSSKATSETEPSSPGEDGKDSSSREKDKTALTREERETRYKEARARIFKDFKEDSPQQDGHENSNDIEMSRSSSVSGAAVKKPTKKNKKPKDDDFEARSAYSQYTNLAGGFSTQMGGGPFYSANGSTSGIEQQSHMQSFPQGNPIPMTLYPHMGFQAQIPGNQWSGRNPATGYTTNQALHGNNYQQNGFAPNFDGQNRAQSFPAVQTTPKLGSPNLARYNSSFQPAADYQNWQSQSFQGMNACGLPMHGFKDGPTMSPTGQLLHFAPNDYPHFQQMDGSYVPNMSHGQFGRLQFDPRSQDFVPSAPNNGIQYTQIVPNHGVSGGLQRFSGVAPMQNFYPQATTGASAAGGIGPVGFTKLSSSSDSSRGRGSNAAASFSQFCSQRSPRKGQNATQANSISKWGSPATLPPKPPPPATSMPYQSQRPAEQQQALPPHPFGLNHASNQPTTTSNFRS